MWTESWGPTGAAELAQARREVETELVEDEIEEDEEDEEMFEELCEDDLDAGLIERIDALDLIDNVWEMEGDSDDSY